MAITQTAFSVGTAAILIVDRDDNPQQVTLHNHEHANNHEIYVGASNVTAANGLHVRHTETLQIVVAPGDQLYAIADGASRDLRVLVRNV